MKSLVPLLLAACLFAGCNSPYHADRGLLSGGLAGAGTGALLAMLWDTPARVPSSGRGWARSPERRSAARSMKSSCGPAEIAAHMGGRQIPSSAVTMADVVNMSRASVSDALIITHIQHNGLSAPLTPPDLIFLKQQNVSDAVIQAMQAPPTGRDRWPWPPARRCTPARQCMPVRRQ